MKGKKVRQSLQRFMQYPVTHVAARARERRMSTGRALRESTDESSVGLCEWWVCVPGS